ncbi:MAG: PqqD family protein [Alphaproteobacteria bacterium]|nr:PqqD family protein [Alphaproteobacteria bacterium]
MTNQQFIINAPSVVSEMMDGEVVIMNLKSGNYHSSLGIGAVVWAWIEERKSVREIQCLTSRRYDASAEEITVTLKAFFDRLVEEDLVREVAVEDPDRANAQGYNADTPSTKERYEIPELCTYTDMQDLLLLDPIHDVGDAGWPKPRDDKSAEPSRAAKEG